MTPKTCLVAFEGVDGSGNVTEAPDYAEWTWTWKTVDGESTLTRDEPVCLDDGTEGLVDFVDLRGPVPEILVIRRRFAGDNSQLPSKWVYPANIVG